MNAQQLVFFNHCNIMDYVFRRWVGGQEGGRGSWGTEGGLGKHSDTNSSATHSVGDLGWHNSQGRPGLPLESVWHPMQSY